MSGEKIKMYLITLRKTVASPRILRVDKLCANSYYDSRLRITLNPYRESLLLSFYHPSGWITAFEPAMLNPFSGVFPFSPTRFFARGEIFSTNTSGCFTVDRIHADIYFDRDGSRLMTSQSSTTLGTLLDPFIKKYPTLANIIIPYQALKIGMVFNHPHTYFGPTHLMGLNQSVLGTEHAYHAVYADQYCQHGRCISSKIGDLTMQGNFKALSSIFYGNDTFTVPERVVVAPVDLISTLTMMFFMVKTGIFLINLVGRNLAPVRQNPAGVHANPVYVAVNAPAWQQQRIVEHPNMVVPETKGGDEVQKNWLLQLGPDEARGES